MNSRKQKEIVRLYKRVDNFHYKSGKLGEKGFEIQRLALNEMGMMDYNNMPNGHNFHKKVIKALRKIDKRKSRTKRIAPNIPIEKFYFF